MLSWKFKLVLQREKKYSNIEYEKCIWQTFDNTNLFIGRSWIWQIETILLFSKFHVTLDTQQKMKTHKQKSISSIIIKQRKYSRHRFKSMIISYMTISQNSIFLHWNNHWFLSNSDKGTIENTLCCDHLIPFDSYLKKTHKNSMLDNNQDISSSNKFLFPNLFLFYN